jgi:hypothetical protein
VVKDKGRAAKARPFVYSKTISGTPASNQVDYQRNYGEDDQQVDKEACDVKKEKTAGPEEHEDNGEKKKHGVACLLGDVKRLRNMRAKARHDSCLGKKKL